jgi:two-component system, NtrC family, sensor kinase
MSAPRETPHRPIRAGPSHHQRTVTVLRLLEIASIVLPILMLCIGGKITWEQKRQDASDQTDRLVDLLYEGTSKLIDAQLLALDQLRLTVEPLDDSVITTRQRELHDRLAAMLHYLPHLRDLYVVGRTGEGLLDGTTYPVPIADFAQGRDFFQYFEGGGTGLFIGLPGNRYSDGLAFVPMTIARRSADGKFNGVISSSVDPDYFERFFEQVLSAYPDFDGRTISLRRVDGERLVRSQDLSPQAEAVAVATAAQQLKTGATSGHLISHRLGEARIVAWRRLRGLDLVLFTSVSVQGVLHGWAGTMTPYAFFAACSALALFSITGVALRRTRMAEAAEQEAADERLRREQAEEAVRQGQKMEALGQLTGGVAHDFNNLLAVIQGSAELAKTPPPERIGRLLDNILHAAQRGASLTRQLLSFSRSQSLAPRVIDPYSEIPHLMELLKPSLRGDIAVAVRVADDVWLVEIDPGEWEIALLNIAVNARDAMPQGGTLTVEVSNQRFAPGDIAAVPDLSGDLVRVAVTDTGPGILPDVAARAFEPFFTTKDIGRGTGLGLSQVYGFARQTGGAATIAAGEGGGTTVTLYLPRSQKRVETAAPTYEAKEVSDSGVKRVLLVEDNHDVAAITAEIIQTLGYEVVHVDRARAALDRLMEPGAVFHLMLTDIVMPDGMDGLQLGRTVRARLPVLPIILVSGYNDAITGQPTEFQVLRKPLPVEQLAEVLRAELGSYPRIVVDNTRAG